MKTALFGEKELRRPDTTCMPHSCPSLATVGHLLNLLRRLLCQWSGFLAQVEGVPEAWLQLLGVEGADAGANDEGEDGGQHRLCCELGDLRIAVNVAVQRTH